MAGEVSENSVDTSMDKSTSWRPANCTRLHICLRTEITFPSRVAVAPPLPTKPACTATRMQQFVSCAWIWQPNCLRDQIPDQPLSTRTMSNGGRCDDIALFYSSFSDLVWLEWSNRMTILLSQTGTRKGLPTTVIFHLGHFHPGGRVYPSLFPEEDSVLIQPHSYQTAYCIRMTQLSLPGTVLICLLRKKTKSMVTPPQ